MMVIAILTFLGVLLLILAFPIVDALYYNKLWRLPLDLGAWLSLSLLGLLIGIGSSIVYFCVSRALLGV